MSKFTETLKELENKESDPIAKYKIMRLRHDFEQLEFRAKIYDLRYEVAKKHKIPLL